MPLDPPVTIAARCAMALLLVTVGCGAAFHHLCLDSGGVHRPLPFLVALLARRHAGGRLRRLRQARQTTPAARADRPAGGLPRGQRQDAQRPGVDGRRPGPDPGAQRVAPAQGGQPLRLRALRHRPQADHRRRGGALHRSRAMARASRARTSRARSRWPSSRSSRARRWPRTPARPSPSTSPTCPSSATASRPSWRSPSSTGACW